MELVVHNRLEGYAEQIRPLLALREASNSLPLGILGQLETDESADHAVLTVESAGTTLGVVLRMPPWPWTVSRFAGDADAFARLVGEHLARHADLPGEVHGDVRLATSVAARWAEAIGGSASRVMQMRVMACTDLRPPGPPPGSGRPIQPGDIDRVVQWLHVFEREIGLAVRPIDETHRQVAEDVERGCSPLWVWEVDREIVSLAGIGRPTGTGERLGPVYTPPALRGRGFAGALVSQLTAQAFERGREHVFLFTDADNPGSNALYERLGYRHVGDAAHLAVTGPAIGRSDPDIPTRSSARASSHSSRGDHLTISHRTTQATARPPPGPGSRTTDDTSPSTPSPDRSRCSTSRPSGADRHSWTRSNGSTASPPAVSSRTPASAVAGSPPRACPAT